MPLPEYDETEWPLVRITTPKEAATDDEFTQHLDNLAAYYAREQPFGMLVDVRDTAPMSVAQRKQMGKSLDAQARAHPKTLQGLAMVLDSEVQRGIVTAISWFFRPPYPMKVFTNMDEAEGWLRQQLGLRSDDVGASSPG